jgi:hypothetical protein
MNRLIIVSAFKNRHKRRRTAVVDSDAESDDLHGNLSGKDILEPETKWSYLLMMLLARDDDPPTCRHEKTPHNGRPILAAVYHTWATLPRMHILGQE